MFFSKNLKNLKFELFSFFLQKPKNLGITTPFWQPWKIGVVVWPDVS